MQEIEKATIKNFVPLRLERRRSGREINKKKLPAKQVHF